MNSFFKYDSDYLEHGHLLNVSSLKRFSLPVSLLGFLIYNFAYGDSSLYERFAYLNPLKMSFTFGCTFLVIWCVVMLVKENVIIQKTAIWIAIFSAFAFSCAMGLIGLENREGIITISIVYLMVSFAITTRLGYLILLLVVNAGIFYFVATAVYGFPATYFVISLFSSTLLGCLICYSMDKQRREVFYSHKKLTENMNALNKALDIKSTFLGHMSHELRTPLNAIIGFSDLIQNAEKMKVSQDKVKEYAAHINNGGTHLLTLVNDILDQNKLEAGEVTVQVEEIGVCETIDGYLDELRPISSNKKQELDLVSCAPETKIHTDRRIFKQIIYNLVSNAQKYTPEKGRVTINIEKRNGDNVDVIVKDTGKGMRQELIDQIENSEILLQSHFISNAEGTGLGLIIVSQLLHRIGANIKVKSAVGKGTEIRLEFPVNFAVN
ncbi:sensor histidine kinase [Pseudemcibacter aquimaris]|uniref:sensor histidine kinase n=1 Tax=Pseudemcibacter aquimaris TaxID=2857064 RepID=UPI002010C8EE|nr:HAMP domain-containing sensor histidine kinase [Pseudemcibacter aquimaris]MCC3860026.1 HAMP domain-containing histidine kinase [Pseudemcibacter aquimaris]WDU57356.1 HAMP domain-containing histidine kinase [Pseudemcibacter aquimaris]